MSVSKEFLMEAVGLSLMVALLFVGLKFFQRTNELITQMDRAQAQRIAEWEEYEIIRYDGKTIDGIIATGYIKSMVCEYQLPVYVETEENTFCVEDKAECEELRNMASPQYMSALALYQCTVIRNENDSIERVEIKVQREEEDE